MPAITSSKTRQAYDRYLTPHWMAQELVKRCPLEGAILEPCAADRDVAIAAYMARQGHQVITADIDPATNVDYHIDATKEFCWQLLPKVDWVITNPPFSLIDEILPFAYSHAAIDVAFLMRSSYFEATMTGSRAIWLRDHPPTMRISLPRYAFTRSPKTGVWQVDSAACDWFLWRKDGWKPEHPMVCVPHTDIEGFHRRPIEEPLPAIAAEQQCLLDFG